VLPTGEVIRTGGRYSKGSTGYDLTQLIVGSEGTLALVTEAILRVYPRLAHGATLLAPFPTLEDVTAAVPQVVASGLGPLMCEYIDMLTMAAITGSAQLELGLPQQVKDTAQAYLVVQLEGRSAERVEEDAAELGELLTKLAAIDVYVLPSTSARRLVDAREKAFWTAKAAGSDDIVDIVVPRAAISALLTAATAVAAEHGSLVIGCGHAGDGNVHLSVFQPDADARKATLRGLFTAGVQLGGTISGEHGVGRDKREYYLELEDPAKVALLRRIKAAFDPGALLNPGVLL
jgi:glycolate oxidase